MLRWLTLIISSGRNLNRRCADQPWPLREAGPVLRKVGNHNNAATYASVGSDFMRVTEGNRVYPEPGT